MRTLLAIFFLVLTMGAAKAEPLADYDRLLATYVRPGADGLNRVDYARWSASAEDRAALDRVVAGLAAERVSTLDRDRQFATWVNLYNAVTLKVILDRFPVRSIRQIRSRGTGLDPAGFIGPWKEKRVTVEGRRLSLDDIEHDILRKAFKDPRVHYAVNCASVGCPNLKASAWRADTLDQDLDAAARAYVNHPRGVSVTADGAVRVSSIYQWFKEDFGGTDAGVLAHLRRYASPELTAKLAGKTNISGGDYDWALNGVS